MASNERRVVVTGLGNVSAIGNTMAEAWTTIEKGGCGIAEIENFDVGRLTFKNGGQVRNFDAERTLTRGEARQMDRFCQLAMVAAMEAVADSGLGAGVLATPESGVILGTGAGGQLTLDEGFKGLYAQDNIRLHPLTIPRYMANAATCQISMKYGMTGPSFTVSTACSSSNHAIGQAFHLIRSGMLDRAITGGSECPFSWGHLCAWSSMRVVSPDLCRPFSLGRRGMILGEGAGILMLEEESAARARGAKIYGEIAGFGMSADAHHLVKPLPESAARAMRLALDDAKVDGEAVTYINAHGTATPVNDREETKAIRMALGSASETVAVSSTKSAHGHGLGAASALEAVVTCMAVHTGVLPATVNFDEPDPDCDLDIIVNQPREGKVDVALSNSFAFGGLNAVLAFRRYS